MNKCICKKNYKNSQIEFLLNSVYDYAIIPVTFWYPQIVRIYTDSFSFVNMPHNEFKKYFNTAG